MAAPSAMAKPKLLFVVTEDSYFCSHRLPLALGAREAGFDVTLAARFTDHGELVRANGISVRHWRIVRGSTGVLAELRSLFSLWQIYRAVRPDLVHHVALKPVLYGSLVARLVRPAGVVNALGGMGSIFTPGAGRKRWLRALVLQGFRRILPGGNRVLILQNEDDAALVTGQAGVPAASLRLIRGAGVNLTEFGVHPEPDGMPLVVLPARMLWDKGIGEFAEAVRLLKEQGVAARFALVGGLDECNPSGIAREQLVRWADTGLLEWWGMRNDMPEVLRMANIVCLPSYREGLPKALLEAAASGRAIVTTDVPGCREIVRDGENGILVPVRDPAALAAALHRLIGSPALRAQMGQAGRRIAADDFSEERVVAETVKIYREVMRLPLAGGSPARAAGVPPCATGD